MALSANQLEILISARDNATKVIKGVSSSLASLAKAGKSVGSGLGKAFSAVKNSIFNLKTAVLGLAGTAGFVALTKSILQTGGAFEDYKATLKTVLGSQEAANKSFDWLKKFAQTTPFEIDNLTQSFVRLAAYGIKGEEVMGTLGDTAAAMGKDIMQAVEALADAQTGEFERLKEFGVKAIQITKSNASSMNATMAEVGQTALSYTDKHGKEMFAIIDRNNREIITSTLMGIWNERYAGAMAERSQTMNGMLSNLSDAWTNWKAQVAENVLPAVKDAFSSLLNSIQEFTDNGTLSGWANLTAQSIESVIQWVSGFVSSFKQAFINMGMSMYSFQQNMDGIRESGVKMGEKLLQTIGDLRDWLAANGPGMWEGIKSGAQSFLSVIKSISSAIDSIKRAWKWLTEENILAQLSKSAGEALGGSTARAPAGLLPSGSRASGGGVMANRPYMVGERGPELFTPSTAGSISASGGGTTIINNIYTAATAHGINNALAARKDTGMRSARVGMNLPGSSAPSGFTNLNSLRSR